MLLLRDKMRSRTSAPIIIFIVILPAIIFIVILPALFVNTSSTPSETAISFSSSGYIQQNLSGYIQQNLNPTTLSNFTYRVGKSGIYYQLKNGTSDQIIFQSPSSSQVFNSAIGNCSAGSSIDFEPGLYVVDKMWSMLDVSNITLSFQQGSELLARDNLDTSVLMVGMPYNPSNNITITGITINGNAEKQEITYSNSWNQGEVIQYPNGITLAGSNNTITNARIYNCRVMGIAVAWTANNGDFTPETNNGIAFSEIYDCGWNGAIFYGSPLSTNSYLTKSRVGSCSDAGVSVTGGINTLISGNYFHDMNTSTGSENSRVGIAIEGGSNSTISDNIIINSCIGIGNWGYPNNKIVNNWISVSGDFYVSYGSGGSWHPNNPTVFHETWGIVSSGRNNIIAKNNIVGMLSNTTSGYYNLGGNGIWLSNEEQSQIFGNTISNCQGYAIYINVGDGKSKNNIISENLLISNSKNVFDNNVPQNIFINNTGYNPIGPLTNYIVGNYLNDGFAVGVWGSSNWTSSTVYTNSGSIKVVSITKGDVTSITHNGETIFTSTNCSLMLQPGDTFSVTFSSTPVIEVLGK